MSKRIHHLSIQRFNERYRFLKINNKGNLMNNSRLIETLEKIEKYISEGNREKWLNINAVKEYTSLSISKIRRSVANGQLKSSKKAGRLLFKISWIEKWLNS